MTEFKEPGLIINEKSPCDASFNYAVSKKKGEELVKKYSHKFPVAIVRLAAIYSDWCEYGPLYYFLKTWLEKNWRSNILAGKGEAAVPYLHVKNLNTLFYKIILNTNELPKYDIYIASPDGCISQKKLYDIAVRYNLLPNQFREVQGGTRPEPFRLYLFQTAKQELAKMHDLFDDSKGSLGGVKTLPIHRLRFLASHLPGELAATLFVLVPRYRAASFGFPHAAGRVPATAPAVVATIDGEIRPMSFRIELRFLFVIRKRFSLRAVIDVALFVVDKGRFVELLGLRILRKLFHGRFRHGPRRR